MLRLLTKKPECLDAAAIFGARNRAGLPLPRKRRKLRLLPRRLGSERPVFSSARRSDAFSALLPHTSVGLLGWPDKTPRKVAALVEKAPAFFVDTGTMPDYIPDSFRDFLDRV